MTELLVILSLIVGLAIVIVLVFYLCAIIYNLWEAGTHLSNLADGLGSIRDNTAPLEEDIPAINGALVLLLQGLLDVNGNLTAISEVAKTTANPRM